LFSVKWLQEQLPVLRERAIDNPTRKNVSIYLYAQRVMMDKADRFSTMFQRVALTDPLLDENNRFPFATAFRSVTLRARSWAQKEILKGLSKKAGIFFFYKSDCKYCHFQIFPLKQFVARYGFELKLVSLDGKPMPGAETAPFMKDSGQAKAWNITVVPAIVLAAPPDRVGVVSQGLLSTDALVSRILLAAEELELLSPDELRLAHLEQRGILTPEDTRMPEGVDPNDPDAWMAYLRERLELSMGGPDPVYSVLPSPTQADRTPHNRHEKPVEARLRRERAEQRGQREKARFEEASIRPDS
jgi:conjugal transfer pilus assembly protein TraF